MEKKSPAAPAPRVDPATAAFCCFGWRLCLTRDHHRLQKSLFAGRPAPANTFKRVNEGESERARAGGGPSAGCGAARRTCSEAMHLRETGPMPTGLGSRGACLARVNM